MTDRVVWCRVAGLWGAAVAVGLSGGCSTGPTVAAPATLTSVDRGVEAAVSAVDVYPDRDADKRYAEVEGASGGFRRLVRRTPDGFEVRSVGEGGVERVLTLRRDADGSVVLLSSREGARTTAFEGGLVYMPASLALGETFEATAAVRVTETNDRGQTRERSSGTATRRVAYVGEAAIEAGIAALLDGRGSDRAVGTGEGAAPLAASVGQPTARVVEGLLELDLDPAKVRTTTVLWVTGRGIVREQQATSVRVFGVPVESRGHDVVLVGDAEGGRERRPRSDRL
ncbi:MAG: hypothetical protein R3B68_03550 [Phycisphaerales bacterium]